MFTGLVGPFAASLLVLALAIVFTRLWVNDTASLALRELRIRGIRPGQTYKLGSAWALVAVRDRRNLLWALLAVSSWVVATAYSVDLVTR
jgi:hypothetical protein